MIKRPEPLSYEERLMEQGVISLEKRSGGSFQGVNTLWGGKEDGISPFCDAQ